jgi:hypothetical protein
MTVQTCEGSHYTCGKKQNWLTGGSSDKAVQQSRDNKISFMLGATEITVVSQQRTFSISVDDSWYLDDGFLMKDEDGNFFQCGDVVTNADGDVSENYTYITTTSHFLDTRHGNGVFTEVKDVLTFSDTGEMCGFKETWGINWYHKFVIESCSIQRTTTYYVVLAGVKTILKTVVETVPLYTAGNPLILVFPNPPSEAIPWLNCDDIKAHGFYDYHEGGPPPGGSQRIEEDGGDDFYWPEWIRNMGTLNHDADAAMAADRYLTYYLIAPDPGTETITNPDIFTDSTPCASVAVDAAEKVFYSLTLGGQNFNHLEDGDLLKLFPYFSADPKFYPVGVI